MALPTSRDKTHTPGDPISSALIDKLQDCIISRSHGEIEIPLDLSQRIVSQGTWSIATGGSLSESTNNGIARVPVTVPTGTVVKTVRVRGIQTGTTDIFQCSLSSNTGSGAGSTIIGSAGSSDGATVALQQDAVTPAIDHVTATNTRYFVTLQTSGAGVGARIITGAYLGVSKP